MTQEATGNKQPEIDDAAVLNALIKYNHEITRPGCYTLPMAKALALAKLSIQYSFDAFSVMDEIVMCDDECEENETSYASYAELARRMDLVYSHGVVTVKEVSVALECLNKKIQAKRSYETYERRRKRADIENQRSSTKNRIMDKCGGKCVMCLSETDLTIDHIIPVRMCGGNGDDNLQILCRSCNSKKGAK